MILGIGMDIVEVKRIRDIYERYKDRFLNRVFTEREIAYCLGKANIYECLAGRFSAKEAVVKATKGKISTYKHIDIQDTPYGPVVKVNGIEGHILLSITHIKDIAAATAIWEG